MAFVGASPLASGTTTVTPIYASAVAGHLLVAFVTSNQTVAAAYTLSGATTGWVQRESAVANPGASGNTTEIWDKLAVGSDTMPTWNGGTQGMACIVAEFSGTTVFDKGGTATGTVSPVTVTATGADGGTGRLVVSVTCERNTAATTTWTNNVCGLGVGTGLNILGDNGATSLANHHRSLYVTTATTGTSADNNVSTWSVVSTRAALAIASYTLAPVVITPPNASLVITRQVPIVSTPRTVTPPSASLVITGRAPIVSTPRTVTPPTASLVLTGFAPTVSTPRVLTPASASLVLTTFAPTVTATAAAPKGGGGGTYYYTDYTRREAVVPEPIFIRPSPARLRLKTFPPTVWISTTITAYAPTVRITRYITSDEIMALWATEVLTTYEAMAAIKEARHNQCTGKQYRSLEQASLMEIGLVESSTPTARSLKEMDRLLALLPEPSPKP